MTYFDNRKWQLHKGGMICTLWILTSFFSTAGNAIPAGKDMHAPFIIENSNALFAGNRATHAEIKPPPPSHHLPLVKQHSRAKKTDNRLDFSQIDADYQVGHFEEARWALEDMQKANSHNGNVFYRMGLVQERMLDFDAARSAYKRAASSMSAPAPAYFHLGGLLYKMKQYPQAVTAYKHVLKLKPNNAYASYMLGMSLMNTGKYADSISAFNRTSRIDHTFRQKAMYGQGIDYIRMGQQAKGESLLRESIALDPTSEVAAVAKKSLTDAINLENTNYLSFFGLYGAQHDSNVVLKPSTSPNLPIITGASDSEHTFLLALNYAPPPAHGRGYKVSARAFENAHNHLRAFDVTDLGLTVTPYLSVNDKKLVFLDASFDYIFLRYHRYMDTISLKPSFTYTPNKRFQLMFSMLGSRQNFYQPVAVQSSNQDGWLLKESFNIYTFSLNHKNSVQFGAHYTTSRTRGSDWSYNAFGGDTGIDITVPDIQRATAGLHASIEYYKYLNMATGFTRKRRDIVYNGSLSTAYHFSFADISLIASYTHEISTLDVYTYARVTTGINVSRSF